jgi:hypothetical protein
MLEARNKKYDDSEDTRHGALHQFASALSNFSHADARRFARKRSGWITACPIELSAELEQQGFLAVVFSRP